jgi:hypothetical protein
MNRCNEESPIQIKLVNVFISFEDRLGCAIGEVVDCCEAYLSAQCEKEWNLVYKEDVRCQRHFMMEFEKVFWYPHKVPGHMSWFLACGLSFQGCDVFSPDFV